MSFSLITSNLQLCNLYPEYWTACDLQNIPYSHAFPYLSPRETTTYPMWGSGYEQTALVWTQAAVLTSYMNLVKLLKLPVT